MSSPHLIGPLPVSTPADVQHGRGRRRDLPDDLLKAASLRLGIMSLLFAVLWVVGVTAGHLAAHVIYPDSPRWLQLDMGDAIAMVKHLPKPARSTIAANRQARGAGTRASRIEVSREVSKRPPPERGAAPGVA